MARAVGVGLGDLETRVREYPASNGIGEPVLLRRELRIVMEEMLLSPDVPDHPVRIVGREIISLYGAPVVRDEVDPAQPEHIEQGRQLPRDTLMTVVTASFVRLPISLEVDRDDMVRRRQIGHGFVPHVPRVRDTVQVHDRLARTRLDQVPGKQFRITRCLDERCVIGTPSTTSISPS